METPRGEGEHPEVVFSNESVARLSPEELVQSSDTHTPTTTITSSVVNGIGQWKSWRRSFATPLLAMLDLMDNALDAAVGSGEEQKAGNKSNSNDSNGNSNEGSSSSSSSSIDGSSPSNSNITSRIVIQEDKPHSSLNKSNNETTGLTITNSSVEPIKPMRDILRVYNSGKSSYDDGRHIGQNGVGLKQGCATLSPCSFCISKTLTTSKTTNGGNAHATTTTSYSLGILAGSLQSEHQCFLPVLEQDLLSGTSAQRETSLLQWAHQSTGISRCIRDYGLGSLKFGVQRLDKHMTEMAKGNWRSYNDVFRLVLFGLSHSSSSSSSDDEEEDPEHDRVMGLLDQLIEDLPRRYLHVPDHVSVIILHQRIHFGYWQYRMAEMARFDMMIKKRVAIANDPNWNVIANDNKNNNNNDDDDDGDCYSIRVFIGFDFVRLSQEDSSNDLAMHIYSRRSGRLIKTIPSARHQLALSSGSSDYNQALTILIDDYTGNLPLNPTKQDLAFSEEAHGEIHHRNLMEWTRIATRVYYRYYKDLQYSKSKELITEALKWVANNKALPQESDDEEDNNNAITSFPPLQQCQFNRFKGDLVKSITKNGKIKLAALKFQELVVGEHSQKFQMPSEDMLLEDPRIAQLTTKKRKHEEEPATLLAEKNEEIHYLTGRIDEVEGQLVEGKTMTNTEQAMEMSDRIDELEGALQDYEIREREWEEEKSLLMMDCHALKKEIKRLKSTMEEKDRSLEWFRKKCYGGSKNQDPSSADV